MHGLLVGKVGMVGDLRFEQHIVLKHIYSPSLGVKYIPIKNSLENMNITTARNRIIPFLLLLEKYISCTFPQS